ncbi:MAG: hypothetical protein DMF67_15945 [Acidobacteria bacterium]|nr:MAG: hypothetical protein DMF67_15945 [Acidobacteriota bacterium]
MRKKSLSGATPPRPESSAVKVHEGAGCEDEYLHTPGGVEFERDGRTVFDSREEASEDEPEK